jgi:hypothetical protein
LPQLAKPNTSAKAIIPFFMLLFLRITGITANPLPSMCFAISE